MSCNRDEINQNDHSVYEMKCWNNKHMGKKGKVKVEHLL